MSEVPELPDIDLSNFSADSLYGGFDGPEIRDWVTEEYRDEIRARMATVIDLGRRLNSRGHNINYFAVSLDFMKQPYIFTEIEPATEDSSGAETKEEK